MSKSDNAFPIYSIHILWLNLVLEGLRMWDKSSRKPSGLSKYTWRSATRCQLYFTHK